MDKNIEFFCDDVVSREDGMNQGDWTRMVFRICSMAAVLSAGNASAFDVWTPPSGWIASDRIDSPTIQLFEFNTPTQKRWLVTAPLGEVQLEARMAHPSKRFATTEQATGCRVAINGGYFDWNTGKSASVFVRDGQLLGIDERNIDRGTGKLGNPARALLGFEGGVWGMRWARSNEGQVVAFAQPTNPWEIPTGGTVWSVQNAVGGGPMLAVNGVKRITADEELFDAASGVAPNGKHARTAVGLDGTGRVYLLVVDGRRSDATGATMNDLADMLLTLGATQAMNLDGGGSSTLVVDGEIVNQPSDGSERKVSTVLCLK
jgi:hypothetical protein